MNLEDNDCCGSFAHLPDCPHMALVDATRTRVLELEDLLRRTTSYLKGDPCLLSIMLRKDIDATLAPHQAGERRR